MEVDVLNMEGKKVSTVELPAAIFEAPINIDLMHQAFVRQMANAHLGTHETKTRNEVARWWYENHGVKKELVVPARVQPVQRNGKVAARSIRRTCVHMCKICPEKCARAALRSAIIG